MTTPSTLAAWATHCRAQADQWRDVAGQPHCDACGKPHTCRHCHDDPPRGHTCPACGTRDGSTR